MLSLVAEGAELEEVAACWSCEGEGAEGVGHCPRDEGTVGKSAQERIAHIDGFAVACAQECATEVCVGGALCPETSCT